jgi:hypothetical protein
VQQWYTYENGALLIYQEVWDGHAGQPLLVFNMGADGWWTSSSTRSNNRREQLHRRAGERGVIIDLIYHDSQTYDVCTGSGADNGQLTLQFKTRYVDVWMNIIAERPRPAR